MRCAKQEAVVPSAGYCGIRTRQRWTSQRCRGTWMCRSRFKHSQSSAHR